MDKKLLFAKTQKELEAKIREIINDEKNPQYVRNAFSAWLKWFVFLKKEIKQTIFCEDLDPNSNEFYRAFVIPAQNFYAIQLWERHPNKPLTRCLTTLYANRLDETNWTKNIYDNRKQA